jgi:hypothetical protein
LALWARLGGTVVRETTYAGAALRSPSA